jgi:hypothetical protein
MPYGNLMLTFIETPLFSRLLPQYLTDDEYAALQPTLIQQPEIGDVVPGSGGVRKMRWSMEGRGKRGGLRVIYYLRTSRGEIWMLTLYSKNIRENISADALRRIKLSIDNA